MGIGSVAAISSGPMPIFEIVGVGGDVRVVDSTKAAPIEVCFHALRGPLGRVALAVRADPSIYRNPLVFDPAVRSAGMAVDGSQPVTQIDPLAALRQE